MQPTAPEPEICAIPAVMLQMLSRLLNEADLYSMDLAHRLHKEFAGSLVACVSLGEMIRHELANDCDAESLNKLLATQGAALRQPLQMVRDLTEEQFPPVLKAFGLNVALQQLVRSTAEDFPGSLVLHINGDEPTFDLPRRLNLFRIMQALLKHCAHYAQTSWVEVTCRNTSEKLVITIDHDGVDSIWSGSHDNGDLAVIEARCLLLGSRLQITPAGPGSSSRVSLVVFPAPAATTP